RGDVEDPVADPVRVLVPVPEALAVEPLDPGHRMVEQGRGVVAEEGFGAGIVVFGQHRGRVGLDGRGGGRGGDQAAEGGTEEAGVGGGHRGPHGNRAGRIRPTLPGSAARRTRPAVLNPLPRSPGGAGILPGPCGWGARLSSRRPVPPSSPASVPPHAAAAAEVRPPLPAAVGPGAVRGWTATTALGTGADAQLAGLRSGRSGLRPNDFGPLVDGAPLPCWIGRVDGLEDAPLPAHLAHWECRNNRLAWIALQADGLTGEIEAATRRHGAARVAIVVGTSTSAIGATEEAYTRLEPGADGTPSFPPDLARRAVHTVHALGAFVQEATGLQGP